MYRKPLAAVFALTACPALATSAASDATSMHIEKTINWIGSVESDDNDTRTGIYVLTISNVGEQPIMSGSLELSDTLPDNIAFANDDFDGLGPTEASFEFTANRSGLSLAEADIAYSGNARSGFSYIPAVGIDPTVRAIRFSPKGEMAPHSQFSIRFRVVDRGLSAFSIPVPKQSSCSPAALAHAHPCMATGDAASTGEVPYFPVLHPSAALDEQSRLMPSLPNGLP
jgi:hypothetical protein